MSMYMNLKMGKVAVATLLLVSTFSFSATEPKYNIIDLRTVVGLQYSYGRAVNEKGQFAGFFRTTSNISHAFVADNKGNMIDLGTLGGTKSEAWAINDSGQVVGYSYDNNNNKHAFVTDSENYMIDLGTLGGIYSNAMGINDNGQVVGLSKDTYNNYCAFVTDSENNMIDLGTLGGSSIANVINDSGQVAGTSYAVDGKRHAFVTDSENNMIDLGTLGGKSSAVKAINNSGQVAGWSYNKNNNMHAFVTDSENNMIDLGTFGGRASAVNAINNSGQVAGWSYDNNDNAHAFVTDSEGNMIDLGTFGGIRSNAMGINDSGQVVGYADDINGNHHAYVTGSNNEMIDLNEIVQDLSTNWKNLEFAYDISNSGYIIGKGISIDGKENAFLLTPIIKQAPIFLIDPIITSITDTNAVVTWKTDIPSTSVVNYGLTESVENNLNSETLTTEHRVVIEGLTYSTLYYVNVMSVDEKGNASETSETITFATLADTTPPVFRVKPENKTFEATGLLTSVNLGKVYVTDNGGGEVLLANDAPKAGFALGTTTVTWTATDESGNTATETQMITVQDTTAPVLIVPSDITIRSNRRLNIVDFGTATATDIFEPVTIVNDAPVEGFPRKSTTTVTWTATDVNGNTATATQLVTLTNKKEKK